MAETMISFADYLQQLEQGLEPVSFTEEAAPASSAEPSGSPAPAPEEPVAEAETADTASLSEPFSENDLTFTWETQPELTNEDEVAEAEPETQALDVDSIWEQLLAAATPHSPAASATPASASTPASPAQESTGEQRLERLEQMLQQSFQMYQNLLAVMQSQKENEMFRQVAQELQAQGVFLGQDQIRQIWDDSIARGIPPSVAIKAAAFDLTRGQMPAPSRQQPRTDVYPYPFLHGRFAEESVPETKPNESLSFRDYLRQVEQNVFRQVQQGAMNNPY